ncbi:MAG: DUF1326 domain-containing protein [Rhizobiaceae bacterium]
MNHRLQRNGEARRDGDQFIEASYIAEGHFTGTPLAGLTWAHLWIWPGRVEDGDGQKTIILDERATYDQRVALQQILSAEVSELGESHFSAFNQACPKVVGPIFAPIYFVIDIEARDAILEVPDVVRATGSPEEIRGTQLRRGQNQPVVEFETGGGVSAHQAALISANLPIELDNSHAKFCVHHYDQDGLVAA